MNKISDITRQDILDVIKEGFIEEYDEPEYNYEIGKYVNECRIFMPFNGRLDVIDFFSRLYDLKTLPSYDSRYNDALGDISCHLGWGDYEEYWFFQDRRFQLHQDDGDEPLLRFVCEMLHPAVRIERSPWKEYLKKFNELLHADGYELYAAEHISGRDVYKVRVFDQREPVVFPDNLFSERYKELIHYGSGEPIDNISGKVDFAAKKHLCKVMFEYAEPQSVQRNRYDNWTDNTDALEEAINNLNDYLGIPMINLEMAAFSPVQPEELLAAYFTPFIFDVIEYQFKELSNGEKGPFQRAVNEVLEKENLSFRLSDRGLIELQADQEILSSEIMGNIDTISEPGLRDLMLEAVEKHMQPSIRAHRDAVEKIWDALERLKTYNTDLDKKDSVSKIINDMADGNQELITVFNAEFKTLTDIGNKYRIRHHETNKVDIRDVRHYDYFFNRCLSLIALATQYLQ